MSKDVLCPLVILFVAAASSAVTLPASPALSQSEASSWAVVERPRRFGRRHMLDCAAVGGDLHVVSRHSVTTRRSDGTWSRTYHNPYTNLTDIVTHPGYGTFVYGRLGIIARWNGEAFVREHTGESDREDQVTSMVLDPFGRLIAYTTRSVDYALQREPDGTWIRFPFDEVRARMSVWADSPPCEGGVVSAFSDAERFVACDEAFYTPAVPFTGASDWVMHDAPPASPGLWRYYFSPTFVMGQNDIRVREVWYRGAAGWVELPRAPEHVVDGCHEGPLVYLLGVSEVYTMTVE